MVDLVTVDERYHVGILFDRTRFAQVRHHRTLVGALLEGAIQLRQRNHRAIELLGDRFQGPRDFGNFVDAALLGARHLHQLQIIDHDQRQITVLALQPAGPRAQLARRQRRRIVDEQGPVFQGTDCRSQTGPVLLQQLTVAQPVLIDAPDRGQHADDQ